MNWACVEVWGGWVAIAVATVCIHPEIGSPARAVTSFQEARRPEPSDFSAAPAIRPSWSTSRAPSGRPAAPRASHSASISSDLSSCLLPDPSGGSAHDKPCYGHPLGDAEFPCPCRVQLGCDQAYRINWHTGWE